MKSFAETAAEFMDLWESWEKMMPEMDVRELVEPPRKLVPRAPQHPRQQHRTPATAQRYLRTSTRRTQGRKGRLQERGKV